MIYLAICKRDLYHQIFLRIELYFFPEITCELYCHNYCCHKIIYRSKFLPVMQMSWHATMKTVTGNDLIACCGAKSVQHEYMHCSFVEPVYSFRNLSNVAKLWSQLEGLELFGQK